MSQAGSIGKGGGGGDGIITINGDVGSVTGSTVSFLATPNSGSSVSFTASSATEMDLLVTDANSNTIIGLDAGNNSVSGTSNTGLGSLAFAGLGGGINSTAVGYSALAGLGGNEGCTAVGFNSILAMFGNRNTAVGEFSLGSASGASGAYNSCLGYNTGCNLVSGEENLLLGTAGTDGAGSAYTSSESSNILLNNAGVIGESNTIRIGTDGSGGGQQNTCFIAGILGASVSNPLPMVIDSSTGQIAAVSSSLKPAVQAQVNAVVVNNVTGDGTTYTVIFDNVQFDNLGNYNPATGIFTAPVTGKYLFGTTIALFGVIIANNNVLLNLNGIGKTNQLSNFNPFPIVNGNTETTISSSTMIGMTAGDTFQVTVRVDGNSTKNIGIAGDSSGAYSYFYGFLVS